MLRMVHLCVKRRQTQCLLPPRVQPEKVAEELATGVATSAEWKALQAHVADIEKT